MSTGHATAHGRGSRSSLGARVIVLLLAAILIALALDRLLFRDGSTPAGTGSGVAATQARSVRPFTGVVVTGDTNVIVRVGPTRSVVVHADDNLLRRVTTRVGSLRLEIGTTAGNLRARTPMFVTVTAPNLDVLRLSGDGNIAVTGTEARKLTVVLSGDGTINATGTARSLDVTISGQGTALLSRLVARDARAVISGDGTIMLTATHRLTARVPGSGTILYGGNPPHVTRTVTGSGLISAG